MANLKFKMKEKATEIKGEFDVRLLIIGRKDDVKKACKWYAEEG